MEVCEGLLGADAAQLGEGVVIVGEVDDRAGGAGEGLVQDLALRVEHIVGGEHGVGAVAEARRLRGGAALRERVVDAHVAAGEGEQAGEAVGAGHDGAVGEGLRDRALLRVEAGGGDEGRGLADDGERERDGVAVEVVGVVVLDLDRGIGREHGGAGDEALAADGGIVVGVYDLAAVGQGAGERARELVVGEAGDGAGGVGLAGEQAGGGVVGEAHGLDVGVAGGVLVGVVEPAAAVERVPGDRVAHAVRAGRRRRVGGGDQAGDRVVVEDRGGIGARGVEGDAVDLVVAVVIAVLLTLHIGDVGAAGGGDGDDAGGRVGPGRERAALAIGAGGLAAGERAAERVVGGARGPRRGGDDGRRREEGQALLHDLSVAVEVGEDEGVAGGLAGLALGLALLVAAVEVAAVPHEVAGGGGGEGLEVGDLGVEAAEAVVGVCAQLQVDDRGGLERGAELGRAGDQRGEGIGVADGASGHGALGGDDAAEAVEGGDRDRSVGALAGDLDAEARVVAVGDDQGAAVGVGRRGLGHQEGVMVGVVCAGGGGAAGLGLAHAVAVFIVGVFAGQPGALGVVPALLAGDVVDRVVAAAGQVIVAGQEAGDVGVLGVRRVLGVADEAERPAGLAQVVLIGGPVVHGLGRIAGQAGRGVDDAEVGVEGAAAVIIVGEALADHEVDGAGEVLRVGRGRLQDLVDRGALAAGGAHVGRIFGRAAAGGDALRVGDDGRGDGAGERIVLVVAAGGAAGRFAAGDAGEALPAAAEQVELGAGVAIGRGEVVGEAIVGGVVELAGAGDDVDRLAEHGLGRELGRRERVGVAQAGDRGEAGGGAGLIDRGIAEGGVGEGDGAAERVDDRGDEVGHRPRGQVGDDLRALVAIEGDAQEVGLAVAVGVAGEEAGEGDGRARGAGVEGRGGAEQAGGRAAERGEHQAVVAIDPLADQRRGAAAVDVHDVEVADHLVGEARVGAGREATRGVAEEGREVQGGGSAAGLLPHLQQVHDAVAVAVDRQERDLVGEREGAEVALDRGGEAHVVDGPRDGDVGVDDDVIVGAALPHADQVHRAVAVDVHRPEGDRMGRIRGVVGGADDRGGEGAAGAELREVAAQGQEVALVRVVAGVGLDDVGAAVAVDVHGEELQVLAGPGVAGGEHDAVVEAGAGRAEHRELELALGAAGVGDHEVAAAVAVDVAGQHLVLGPEVAERGIGAAHPGDAMGAVAGEIDGGVQLLRIVGPQLDEVGAAAAADVHGLEVGGAEVLVEQRGAADGEAGVGHVGPGEGRGGQGGGAVGLGAGLRDGRDAAELGGRADAIREGIGADDLAGQGDGDGAQALCQVDRVAAEGGGDRVGARFVAEVDPAGRLHVGAHGVADLVEVVGAVLRAVAEGVAVFDAVAVAVGGGAEGPHAHGAAARHEDPAVGGATILMRFSGAGAHGEAVLRGGAGADLIPGLLLCVIERVGAAVGAVDVDEALTVEREAVVGAVGDAAVEAVDRVGGLDAGDRRLAGERPADPEQAVVRVAGVGEGEARLVAGDARDELDVDAIGGLARGVDVEGPGGQSDGGDSSGLNGHDLASHAPAAARRRGLTDVCRLSAGPHMPLML
jgi:hypothetical protein